jgi:hypothetical protein
VQCPTDATPPPIQQYIAGYTEYQYDNGYPFNLFDWSDTMFIAIGTAAPPAPPAGGKDLITISKINFAKCAQICTVRQFAFDAPGAGHMHPNLDCFAVAMLVPLARLLVLLA